MVSRVEHPLCVTFSGIELYDGQLPKQRGQVYGFESRGDGRFLCLLQVLNKT